MQEQRELDRLERENAALREALNGLLGTEYAKGQLRYLDKGIGIRTTEGAAWLAARNAILPKQQSEIGSV